MGIELEFERSRVDDDFMTGAREHAQALERGWSSELYAFALVETIFDTSEHVTREEFARASETIFGRYSSIRALNGSRRSRTPSANTSTTRRRSPDALGDWWQSTSTWNLKLATRGSLSSW